VPIWEKRLNQWCVNTRERWLRPLKPSIASWHPWAVLRHLRLSQFRSWQDDSRTVLTPGQRATWWLSWAAAPYAAGMRVRNFGYEHGWLTQRRLPVPVISIGNLTVGGTGKTPIVIEVTQWLLSAGRRVAVLSRGYRRTSRESFLLVSDGREILATQEEAGDEPCVIAQRCRLAVVAVGADRYRSGRRVLEQAAVDCIVLDDGFQHLGLHRDVNVLLVDATDASGLERVLPAGRLREPLTAARRATAVIVTRAEMPHQVDEVLTRLRSAVDTLPMTAQVVFQAVELVSLAGQASRSPDSCRSRAAFLVSGVGHPASFRATVEKLGVTVIGEAAYPDHHRYSPRDVAMVHARAVDLKADLVLTTEKDAGKIRPHLKQDDGRWWAVRLGVEWLTGEADIRKTLINVRLTAGRGVGA